MLGWRSFDLSTETPDISPIGVPPIPDAMDGDCNFRLGKKRRDGCRRGAKRLVRRQRGLQTECLAEGGSSSAGLFVALIAYESDPW